ncbi:hypothetical protein Pla175_07810 [Pirellulimonas nuda]|uniref:Uncharacterized protein n=1 Tax=Pirellulimonas nuda TaxID=2528009 RepID=A0A518D7H9_9BACT|nr:hypothetical protein [Pirellulimonas nuda]QDU87421.1 hypothetical protein Pla175_07810 [Pirellulimonas nuda]
MPVITFFRQKRYDDSIRAGLGLGERSVLQSFVPSGNEPDPALLWYVDLRVEGSHLPTEVEAARRWLVEHEQQLMRELADAAMKLQIGLDQVESGPCVRRFDLQDGVSGTLTVSGIRALDEGELSAAVSETGQNLREIIESLEPVLVA